MVYCIICYLSMLMISTHRMSVIAAGKTYGIAPNADLFLVKIKNCYLDGLWEDNRLSHTAGVQPAALDWVLRRVRDHIEGRLRQDPNTKSVINMSWGEFNFMDNIYFMFYILSL